jgi:hypothetical protein
VLQTAQTFEDLASARNNGAAKYLRSAGLLTIAARSSRSRRATRPRSARRSTATARRAFRAAVVRPRRSSRRRCSRPRTRSSCRTSPSSTPPEREDPMDTQQPILQALTGDDPEIASASVTPALAIKGAAASPAPRRRPPLRLGAGRARRARPRRLRPARLPASSTTC